MKYKQTPGFLQWRDSKHVYGLNFAVPEEVDTFSQWIQFATESLGKKADFVFMRWAGDFRK